MNRRTRKHLVITASIVALFAGGMLVAELCLRRAVLGAVERTLSVTGAQVSVGRVSVSIPRRSVRVRDIHIRAQGNDLAQRGFTVVSLDAHLGCVSMHGVRLGSGGLGARRLTVESPSLSLVTRTIESGDQPAAPAKPFKDIPLEKIAIKTISITGATIDYTQWLSDSESTRVVMGGGNIEARDFSLDSLSGGLVPFADKILFSDNIQVSLDSLTYAFDQGMQELRIDGATLETATQNLSIEKIALQPQLPKEEFARRHPRHSDWTSVSVDTINCTGLDLAKLLSEKSLSIDSVSIAAADIRSFKNRKVFQPAATKPMLQQTIQQLPLPLDIRTVAYRNLDIVYDELPESAITDTPGTVTLTDGSGTIRNLTNIVEGHDRFIAIDYTTALMGSGRIHSTTLLPVAATDNHWEISGRLGPTDMRTFNRALEPLMNAKITSGEIASLDFHLTGTLQRSHMELTMRYDNLGIEFLDRRDRERKLLNFLADDLLIRSDNPGRNGRGRLRSAEGDFTRDPERSMYHFIWHSFVPAILRTVI
ncbi:MAG: hypothetical protein LBV38_03135 [Alistipes sp.]|jgi:hypothetical protein|nr:hypothetical protein [Alistipes sp.]